MAVITSSMQIDGAAAISTLNRVQSAFISYNDALGRVAGQTAAFNGAGRAALITFTQIDSAGRRVTSTVRETANGYQTLRVRTTEASAAQRRLADDLQRQKAMADALAASIARTYRPRGTSTGPTVTTTPGVVDPARLNLASAAFAQMTREQYNAALAARGFSSAQIAGLQGTYDRAQRVAAAFRQLTQVGEAFRSKLNEVGKIAFATAIYRSISLLQLGFTEGIKSAGEYSRQIGLIQTLVSKGNDTYSDWAGSIRAVADEFGRPTIEVAQATYNALSNQIIETTDDMDKIRVATELARNTNSSTASSVDVLSSVINTYGDNAGSAQEISDKLFKTVDLGRVRIDELNGVVGRSASIAQTAGVSFNEIAAGLIVLTQQGLNSAEAATLLNNVYSQLIKPNEALAAQIKKMGFDSGTAAIQTLGFAGVMRELHEASKGASEGIATFFPEIRGLRGAATFAGEGIDKFVDSLKEVEKAAGANAKATEILNQNLGQKLGDEMQRVKNFFTADLGTAALEAVAGMTQAFGGLENVIKRLSGLVISLGVFIVTTFAIKAIVSFIGIFVPLIATFVNFESVIGEVNLALAAQGLSLRTIGGLALGLAGAFAAGFAAVTVILNQIDAANKAAIEKIRDFHIRMVEESKAADVKEASNRVKVFSESVDSMGRIFGKYIARAKSLNNELLSDLQKKAEETKTHLENVFQVFSGISSANLKKAQSEQEKAIKVLTDMKADQIKQDEEQSEAAFRRQMGRIAEYQAQVDQQQGNVGANSFSRAGSAANLAQQAVLARVGAIRQKMEIDLDTGEIDRARESFRSMVSTYEELISYKFNVEKAIASEAANFRAREEAYAAKKLGSLEAEAAKTQELVVAQKDVDDLLAKAAAFATKKLIDKDGGLAQQYIGDPNKARTDLDAIQKKVLDLAGTLQGQIKDPLGMAKFNIALQQVTQGFAKQKKDVDDILSAFATGAKLSEASEAMNKLGTEQKTLNEKLLEQQTKYRDSLTKTTELIKTNIKSIQEAFGTGTISNISGFTNLMAAFGQGLPVEQQGRLTALTDAISKGMSAVKPDIAAVTRNLLELDTMLSKIPKAEIINPSNTEDTITATTVIEHLISDLKQLKDAQTNVNNTELEVEKFRLRYETYNKSLAAFLNVADPGLLKSIMAEKGFIEASTGLTGVAKATNDTAAAFERLIVALGQLRIMGPITVPQVSVPNGLITEPPKFAQGGMVHSWMGDFLSGKFARGTDVIPAMLSKREFVVRAPMAEKYYSQLMAINSGRAPVYKSQGGSVTNNSMGDFHFTIQSKTSNKMAREIMGHIRRANNQGTGRIN